MSPKCTVLESLLAIIALGGEYDVEPPTGIPTITAPYRLPDDLAEFYAFSGGLKRRSQVKPNFGFDIIPPSNFVQADLVIREQIVEGGESASWYLVATDGGDMYFCVDCSAERNGWCYQSDFWGYPDVGFCPIVALSFTELLVNLLNAQDDEYFWLKPDYPQYGDAYAPRLS